ncbi:hypothetical protein B0J11DRAFT_585897 [Dendryphion nanum]|uniref:Uncharacterized protein n=1 Tax=Dendryphion nanum TaxID=256645 RepID=A0A9P9D2P9_9PLEO|nr:hypothetical protein B0J11DRAFT_585897 [Dendryphion nanum]
MNQDLRLQSCLCGTPEERVMRLDEHLSHIRRLLECDKELARRLGFKVQPKNHGDKNRLLKFAEYSGPDNDTLELLDTHAQNWYHQPLQFWGNFLAVDCDVSIDPQEQIYKAFLQSTHDHA